MRRPWVGFKKGVIQAGEVFVYVVGASTIQKLARGLRRGGCKGRKNLKQGEG